MGSLRSSTPASCPRTSTRRSPSTTPRARATTGWPRRGRGQRAHREDIHHDMTNHPLARNSAPESGDATEYDSLIMHLPLWTSEGAESGSRSVHVPYDHSMIAIVGAMSYGRVG